MAGTVQELTSGVPCPGLGHFCPGIYWQLFGLFWGNFLGLCLLILVKIPLEIKDRFYVKTPFSLVFSDIASFQRKIIKSETDFKWGSFFSEIAMILERTLGSQRLISSEDLFFLEITTILDKNRAVSFVWPTNILMSQIGPRLKKSSMPLN